MCAERNATGSAETAESDETLESYGGGVGRGTGSLERVREWLLIEGDRMVIAIGISLGVFALLLALHELGVVALVTDASMTRVASGLIAGTFSLVTLVVSINQLILSREFSTAGETRDRFGGVGEFRRDVADAAGVPASPAEPANFLELLAAVIRDRAEALSDAVADHPDGDARERIDRYAAVVAERTDRIDETLSETEFGTFRVVLPTVRYDDAWRRTAASHLSERHAESSEETREAFDDPIDALELFAVARERFETTCLQRELTRFSQLTIYCGAPAAISAVILGVLYADVGGSAIGLEYLPVAVSALVAVVISPLALLVAYILRTATVTRRTASIGPVFPGKDPEEGPFEGSYGEVER